MLRRTLSGKHLIRVDKHFNIELSNLNYKVSHTVIRAALGHKIAEKHDTGPPPPLTLSLWQEGECFLLVSAGTAQIPEFGQTVFPNGTEELVFSALLPWTGSNNPDLNIFRRQAKKIVFPQAVRQT